jgi:hypothetical protein
MEAPSRDLGLLGGNARRPPAVLAGMNALLVDPFRRRLNDVVGGREAVAVSRRGGSNHSAARDGPGGMPPSQARHRALGRRRVNHDFHVRVVVDERYRIVHRRLGEQQDPKDCLLP